MYKKIDNIGSSFSKVVYNPEMHCEPKPCENSLALTTCRDAEIFYDSNVKTYSESRSGYPYERSTYNVLNEIGLNPSTDMKRKGNCFVNKDGCDPRLVDPVRNIRFSLDQPSLDGRVSTRSLYNEGTQLENYGVNYGSYKDIKTGQILYYTDDTLSKPYPNPLFVITSDVSHGLFKDPMDSVKPIYTRRPVTNTLNYISDLQDTRDQLAFREDIMSKQMAKQYEQRWDLRWA